VKMKSQCLCLKIIFKHKSRNKTTQIASDTIFYAKRSHKNMKKEENISKIMWCCCLSVVNCVLEDISFVMRDRRGIISGDRSLSCRMRRGAVLSLSGVYDSILYAFPRRIYSQSIIRSSHFYDQGQFRENFSYKYLTGETSHKYGSYINKI